MIDAKKKSYRPVSIIYVISKILERCLYDQMFMFMFVYVFFILIWREIALYTNTV